MNNLILICEYLVLIIPVLISIAFVTLMERKILGLSQLRLGPNKAGAQGLLQPFSDAIKLFLKQWESPLSSNNFVYTISPLVAMMIVLLLWAIAPSKNFMFNSSLTIILFIMIMSLGVYPLLMAGWSSSSKYALMGSIRGVAQTISYEISLTLIFITMMSVLKSTSLTQLINYSGELFVLMMLFSVFNLWLISMVAETNRTPFDFAEGESELVSGFNIEYASAGFALIFMAEYGMILMLSGLTAAFYLGLFYFSLSHSLVTSLIAFFWIWLRATYPRYRYDMLMSLAWKSFLPQVLGILMFFSALSIMV